MSTETLDQRIGEAWKIHHKGDHARAIELFTQLLQQSPEHIDVNWGLGLACRAQGDWERATKAFQRVKAVVDAEIEKNPSEYGRLFLLNRMVNQQIDYMSEFVK